MEVNKLKFTANVDGSIICEIFDSLGEPQDILSCFITLNIGHWQSNDAIVSEPMTVFELNKCSVNLTPEQTSMLDIGEYWLNLIIIDSGNKKHTTKKIEISIDRPIE